MQIEGKNAVLEALRASVPLERVMVADSAKHDRAVEELRRLARAAGVPVASVTREALDRTSERGAHQGVIALARPFRYAELAEVLSATERAAWSLIVALDHVTDPGNLGAIARTAEVVGADALVVPSRRSAAITPAAWKAAAGALAHVPVVRETNLVRALDRLKSSGYWVAGASERADQTVWEAPLEGRLVLAMGSEGQGLARLTAETCDFLVRLPQAGRVGSLNVAQATTAIAYEWLRRKRSAVR